MEKQVAGVSKDFLGMSFSLPHYLDHIEPERIEEEEWQYPFKIRFTDPTSPAPKGIIKLTLRSCKPVHPDLAENVIARHIRRSAWRHIT